jgi:hypothetical protein
MKCRGRRDHFTGYPLTWFIHRFAEIGLAECRQPSCSTGEPTVEADCGKARRCVRPPTGHSQRLHAGTDPPTSQRWPLGADPTRSVRREARPQRTAAMGASQTGSPPAGPCGGEVLAPWGDRGEPPVSACAPRPSALGAGTRAGPCHPDGRAGRGSDRWRPTSCRQAGGGRSHRGRRTGDHHCRSRRPGDSLHGVVRGGRGHRGCGATRSRHGCRGLAPSPRYDRVLARKCDGSRRHGLRRRSIRIGRRITPARSHAQIRTADASPSGGVPRRRWPHRPRRLLLPGVRHGGRVRRADEVRRWVCRRAGTGEGPRGPAPRAGLPGRSGGLDGFRSAASLSRRHRPALDLRHDCARPAA